jgi:hypothetical protein
MGMRALDGFSRLGWHIQPNSHLSTLNGDNLLKKLDYLQRLPFRRGKQRNKSKEKRKDQKRGGPNRRSWREANLLFSRGFDTDVVMDVLDGVINDGSREGTLSFFVDTHFCHDIHNIFELGIFGCLAFFLRDLQLAFLQNLSSRKSMSSGTRGTERKGMHQFDDVVLIFHFEDFSQIVLVGDNTSRDVGENLMNLQHFIQIFLSEQMKKDNPRSRTTKNKDRER